MTCADFRATMSAHLDGEAASGPDRSAHSTRCADCAAWLAGARRLRELTLTARGPSPQRSQRLVEAVLHAVAAHGQAGNSSDSVAHEGS